MFNSLRLYNFAWTRPYAATPLLKILAGNHEVHDLVGDEGHHRGPHLFFSRSPTSLQAAAIGELTIENRVDRVSLYGSTYLTLAKVGLTRA